MPRLFTGVEIPDDVALDLDLMRGGISGARWIDRESYHITLRFIGDIDGGLAREISHELEGVEARPFKLRLAGCGVFGGNKPHSLFAGVEESPELRRLQSIHERICQALGLPAEQRKFAPHVTLARLKDPDPRALHAFAASHNLYKSRVFGVGCFVLFSSRPSRGGGPYAVEKSYCLQAGL
ncbi:RNA 2',3'-cyclic phosphodiesterase [Aestuariivirga sp.]|uniref:RNA 2',3'-cyclic phosphodiesterase n=1 Tax=Aestuariivirga sp. TaxID=2650926 RepID=UPI0025B7C645|nr:RNA 2',3'-cyclic phosphodiesterase [Aestuariivirga sp.]MCA3554937.1 RNA 2',3'-cyclic phosphodiesterase [Aestuariivirga sp.]